MMQMAFPGTKDMGEAVAKMQTMMGQMKNQPQNRPGFRPGHGGPALGGGGGGAKDAQLKAALDMLQKIQGKK